jgi:hypothetical protein
MEDAVQRHWLHSQQTRSQTGEEEAGDDGRECDAGKADPSAAADEDTTP